MTRQQQNNLKISLFGNGKTLNIVNAKARTGGKSFLEGKKAKLVIGKFHWGSAPALEFDGIEGQFPFNKHNDRDGYWLQFAKRKIVDFEIKVVLNF